MIVYMSMLRRLALAATLMGVLALQWIALAAQSSTMDEPYHLLAGHQALRWGVNSVNLEHPPLVKLLAALPLLAEERPFGLDGPVAVDGALPASQNLFADPAVAERVRVRSRAVLAVCFALPLLLVAFLLGRVVAGPRSGVLLVVALGVSPTTLPYLSLVQTDAAVALGFTLTVLAGVLLVRTAPAAWERWRTWLSLALLAGLGLGLACATKYSGVLAVPAVLAAPWLASAGERSGVQFRRLAFAAVAVIVAAACVAGTYAVADRHGDAEATAEAVRLYVTGGGTLLVDDELLPWREPLLDLADRSRHAAQWAVGLLGIQAQNRLGVYPSYAFGRVDSDGRWWYFPAAFLVRTPLVLLGALLLAALAFGLRLLARRGGRVSGGSEEWSNRIGGDRALLLLSGIAGLYLASAVASSYNIGLRHLLPILPILYLPAAAWAARTPLRTALLAGLLLVEAVALTPVWMSATNTWWLGGANPTATALGGADGDYEQGLRTLGRVAVRRGWEPLFVLHPTVTEGELRAAAPGATRLGPADHQAGESSAPGYYAVSTLAEQLLPAVLEVEPGALHRPERLRQAAAAWAPLWRSVVEHGERLETAAGTFRIYRIPEEVPDASGGAVRNIPTGRALSS